MIAKYSITDCEHEGDIFSACNDIIKAGGSVITTEWDGEDCGEAYVYCVIDEDKFNKLQQEDSSWSNAEYMRNYFKIKYKNESL